MVLWSGGWIKLHPAIPSGGISPLEVKLVILIFWIVGTGKNPIKCDLEELVFLSTHNNSLGDFF